MARHRYRRTRKSPAQSLRVFRHRVPPYVAQDRPHNCGPIVVFNMLLFLGVPKNKIDIYKIEAGLRCSIPMGTTTRGLTQLLRTLGIRFTRILKPSVRDLENALFEDYGIIYLYKPQREFGHFKFIYGQDRHHFKEANGIGLESNVPTQRKRKSYYATNAKRFHTPPRFKHFGVLPQAWVVKGCLGDQVK